MPIIDLSTVESRPPATEPAATAIDAAPRRLSLTLLELQYAARLAGGAPLPFEVAPPSTDDTMQARLGHSPALLDDQAYRAAVATLHDPVEQLERRGLVLDGRLDGALAGAIGLLAAPRLAVDVDVSMGGVQAKVWHRQDGPAVAALTTVDGIVFELTWFPLASWSCELARVAVVAEDVRIGRSVVPAYADLPFELADAAAEAANSGRGDLLAVLAGRHSGTVVGPDGPMTDDAVVHLLSALSSEAQGRMRALVADVSGGEVDTVGVLSWTLLADGWRALRPHRDKGSLRLEIRAVDPTDLAAVVVPVLGEVTR